MLHKVSKCLELVRQLEHNLVETQTTQYLHLADDLANHLAAQPSTQLGTCKHLARDLQPLRKISFGSSGITYAMFVLDNFKGAMIDFVHRYSARSHATTGFKPLSSNGTSVRAMPGEHSVQSTGFKIDSKSTRHGESVIRHRGKPVAAFASSSDHMLTRANVPKPSAAASIHN